ncbi:MAG: EamA family transporter [Acidimicrobiales bacterium]
MPALLALVSAAVFGAADFAGGYATRRLPVLTVTLLTNIVGTAMAAVLVGTVGGTWSRAAVTWGAVGGAFGLVGLLLLYEGLATGPNRLVSPLSGVISAAIPVIIGVATGDRPGGLAVAGLLFTPPAIWLVAGGDHRAAAGQRRSILLAVGAGVGFGLFFAGIAQTPDDAGAVPLLIARVTSTTLLLVAAARQRPRAPHGREWALPVLAGLLDMTANGLFLWSSRDGDLAVVAALVALYPVTTILLAVLVLRERLSRSQTVGLVVAVTAAALLS